MAAKALEGTVLVGTDHGNGLARQLGLVAVGPAKTVLMLGKAERHDAQACDLLVLLAKAQGLFQLLAVVHAGAQHNLRVNLDAGGHDGLEYVHASLSVTAHHTTADVGLTAWTDTFMGLMLRWMTFCTSSSVRFVSVTKLPCKKLRR